jgi:hypothetical protein
LTSYLASKSHGIFSRSCAGGCIAEIGHAAEIREQCVAIITAQLQKYGQNGAELNGLLICDLIETRATESIETIREAFRLKCVEIRIPGDLEEVEITLGLRTKRDTPPPNYISLGQQAGEKQVRIGRNDPCPCGSGKKYKKCCLQ